MRMLKRRSIDREIGTVGNYHPPHSRQLKIRYPYICTYVQMRFAIELPR